MNPETFQPTDPNEAIKQPEFADVDPAMMERARVTGQFITEAALAAQDEGVTGTIASRELARERVAANPAVDLAAKDRVDTMLTQAQVMNENIKLGKDPTLVRRGETV